MKWTLRLVVGIMGVVCTGTIGICLGMAVRDRNPSTIAIQALCALVMLRALYSVLRDTP